MLKWIKRNSTWIITSLCTVVSFVLWMVFQKHPNLTSLFINLTAGFLVSTFTICIIDRILKKQREKDLKPIQIALHRDVSQLKRDIVSLWSEMYVQSIEQRKEIPIEELFTEGVIQNIYDHLDLEGKPNVTQINNWFQYLEYTYTITQKLGDRILDRYNTVAPPEILQTIHYLTNDSVFAGKWLHMICVIKNTDTCEGIVRLPVLKCFSMFPQEKDFEEIQALIKWCKEYGQLINEKYEEETSEIVYIINPHISPSSVITKEKTENSRYFKNTIHVGTGKPPTIIPKSASEA